MPVNFVDNIQIDKNDMPETNSKHNSNLMNLFGCLDYLHILLPGLIYLMSSQFCLLP
jgi:hypothetical protein